MGPKCPPLQKEISSTKEDIQDPSAMCPKCPPLQKEISTAKEDIQDPDAMCPKCPPLQKEISTTKEDIWYIFRLVPESVLNDLYCNKIFFL